VDGFDAASTIERLPIQSRPSFVTAGVKITTRSPIVAALSWRRVPSALLRSRIGLSLLLAAIGSGVWAVRHRADFTKPENARAVPVAAPDGARASDGRERGDAPHHEAPLRSLSSDDRQALCLAPIPAGSRVRAALSGSMARALALPGRPGAWVDVGQAWMRQLRSTSDSGYALNAEACAQMAQQIAPEHMPALELLGRLRLDAHEFRQAREVAESLLAADTLNLGALGILSDAALELGDVSAARDAAQRLMDRAPGLGAYARASYLRWLHGDEDGAIELARLAIDAAGDPDDLDARAWILTQAAQLFWHRGDHDGAEAGYRMALSVRPEYAPALLALGKVMAGRAAIGEADPGQAQYGEAAELLARALSAHADVETASLLADVSERQGDAVGAARNEALAEQLGRHDGRALALFYANRQREPERAVALARAELGVRGDIYTEDALAWALYASGQFVEAERHAERATRLGTRDALLVYHLGAIRLALGKVSEAKALLEQALRQNPRFDRLGADRARQLLARAGT
jgi:tetratricopeptide (TPR) repeat protein